MGTHRNLHDLPVDSADDSFHWLGLDDTDDFFYNVVSNIVDLPDHRSNGRGDEHQEHLPPLTYDSIAFPDGVSSGDVTQTSAVLWARANQPGMVTFQISLD